MRRWGLVVAGLAVASEELRELHSRQVDRAVAVASRSAWTFEVGANLPAAASDTVVRRPRDDTVVGNAHLVGASVTWAAEACCACELQQIGTRPTQHVLCNSGIAVLDRHGTARKREMLRVSCAPE